MNDKILNAIKFGTNKLNLLIDSNLNKIQDISIKREENFLFGIHSQLLVVNKIKSKVFYQKTLLEELNKITYTKKSSECHMDAYLSSYGSLYYGGDTFYYNETLISYSEEQIFFIICNHICHYLLAIYFSNSVSFTINQKSNVLLFLGHCELIEPILYSQTKRNKLITLPKYKKIVDSTILFAHDSKLLDLIIQEHEKLDFVNICDNIISVLEMFIIESSYGMNVKHVNLKLNSKRKLNNLKNESYNLGVTFLRLSLKDREIRIRKEIDHGSNLNSYLLGD